jgi:hypothetical protein
MIFASLAVSASPQVDALKKIPAPAEEFVRIPAHYVLQKLERTVRDSGEVSLAAFAVVIRKSGVGQQRISINMEGMTAHQALEAVAAATGAGVEYSQGRATLKDPSKVTRPEPVVAPATPTVAEMEKTEQDKPVKFTDVDQALVFIEVGDGRGSGFIAEMGGKTYLFSNQHNFSGASRIKLRAMHGGTLEPAAFEFCKDRDLVRFEMKPEEVETLGVLQISHKTPEMNERIVVYGNSAGGNVATELKGKVLGVGPSDIEVDADIVPGNSGSPILDASGKVLGVATYITFSLKFDSEDIRKEIYKGTRFKEARRYGVRIPERGWVKAPMQNFLQQTYRLADAQNYLEAAYILVQYWNGNEDYYGQAKRIITAYTTSGNRVKPPYKFHLQQTEQELVMMVKAFKQNHDEFIEKINDMDLDKRELTKLRRSFGGHSTRGVEMIDYRIRTGFLNKVKRMQDDLGQYEWMSRYLRQTAEPLDQLSGELIRILEANENPYIRVQRMM